MASIFITMQVFEKHNAFFKDRVEMDIDSDDLYIDVRYKCEDRKDNIIHDAIENNENIHIFTQKNPNDNFKYWGIAKFIYKDIQTVKLDTVEEIIKISFLHFIIKNNDIVGIDIPENPLYKGKGSLKKACLNHIGHPNPESVDISQCFVKIPKK
jgi:hypothetical protein